MVIGDYYGASYADRESGIAQYAQMQFIITKSVLSGKT